MDQNEFSKAIEIKEKLDQVSPSFCLIKWKHATLNLGSGAVKSCCHLPFRKFENASSELTQIHDTTEDQNERKMMLDGQRPRECSYCWWMEDKGHLSDRIVWSSKTWAAPFLDSVVSQKSKLAQAPSWLELNFSNVCNLSCSYCSPIFSSKWQQEIKELGPYPTSPKHNDLNYLKGVELNEKFDNTQMMKKFWPWFEKCYPDLNLLKITGGEPFLSPATFKMLNWIKDNPNPKLNLSINSNLSVPESVWKQFIELIKEVNQKKTIQKFYLHPSIDSFGARAEYIRNGLNFNLFQNHVEDYLEQTQGHIVFICTINNLALGGLLDLWRYLLRLKKTYGPRGQWVSVTTEVLLGPDWQNVNILPESFQSYLIEVIEFVEANKGSGLTEFSDFELHGLKRALDMCKTPHPKINSARKNFFNFFSEHDKRRKTNFHSTFPELIDFWEMCSKLS